MAMKYLLSSIGVPLLRHLRLLASVILVYLLQVCSVPYVSVRGVTPNIIWIMMSVVIVGYNWYDILWCGALYGILMEITNPTITMVNLVSYFAITGAAMPIFMKKNARRLLREKYSGKAGINRHRFGKTVLCTLFMSAFWQVINLGYVFLSNNTIPLKLILQGIWYVVFTGIISLFLIPLLRLLLGIESDRQIVKESENEYTT